LTVSNSNRKIGINVSVPFSYISKIDERAKELGYNKRSNYILQLIQRDLS